jgi:hypothetical protein
MLIEGANAVGYGATQRRRGVERTGPGPGGRDPTYAECECTFVAATPRQEHETENVSSLGAALSHPQWDCY